MTRLFVLALLAVTIIGCDFGRDEIVYTSGRLTTLRLCIETMSPADAKRYQSAYDKHKEQFEEIAPHASKVGGLTMEQEARLADIGRRLLPEIRSCRANESRNAIIRHLREQLAACKARCPGPDNH